MAHFDTIPEEIWVQILRISMTKVNIHCTYMVIEMLLPLMFVSTRWFRRIQSTPVFWTDVVLDKLEEDWEMKLSLLLHFSQNADLTLYLLPNFPGKDHYWEQVRAFLLPAHRRITRVELFLLEIWESNTQLYEDLLIFPAIRSFHYFSQNRLLNQQFMNSFSSITKITGSLFEEDKIKRLPTRLQSFSTYSPPHIVLPLIKNLDSLKEVVFHHLYYEEVIKWPYILNTELGWTHLTYEGWNYQGSNIILPRLTTTLLCLNLTIDLKSLASFLLPVLSEFKRLSSFTLCVSGGVGEDLAEIPPPWVSQVRSFSWRSLSNTVGSTAKEKVISFFQQAMRQVQQLEIIAPNSRDIYLFLYNNDFAYLETLTVSCPRHLNDDPSTHLQSLVANNFSLLSIEFDVPSEILPLLASSTADHVVYKRPLDGLWYGRQYGGNFTHWNNVVTLDFRFLVTSFNGLDLPYLKTLIIGDRVNSEIWNYGIGGATHFCVHLGLKPTSCPSLEHLELASFPEWDIFFIMLERRNFLSNPSISPLKHVALPHNTTRTLRQLVLPRIKGIMTTRPSNYQLSLTGNLDVIYDVDLPGCFTCYRGLRYCQYSRATPAPSKGKERIARPHLEYPTDEEAILSTWVERIPSKWDNFESTNLRDQCRENYGPLVHITDLSDEDPTYDENYDSWIHFALEV